MKKIPNKYKNLIIIIVYILLTFIIFYKKVLISGCCYGMSDVDTDGSFWYYWMKAFADKNMLNFNVNYFLTYPFGYDTYYIPFANIHGAGNIIPFLIKLFNINTVNFVLLSNLSMLLSYPASAISTYFLSLYITKNRLAAFCSGTIFVFSYFFILMGRGSLSHNHIEFIPLFFLLLFLYLDKKKLYYLILSIFSFAFLLNINAYWAFFCGAFSSLIFIFYTINKQIKPREIVKYYLILLSITCLLNFNFIMQNSYTLNSEKLELSGKTFIIEKQLNNVLSLFAPSKSNFFYINFNYGDSGLFLGYATLIIALAGLFFKKINKFYILFFSCFLLSATLMTFTPVFSTINKLYFQFFGMFRNVSRLYIFCSLFLSLMAGLSVSYIYNKIKTKKQKILFLLVYSLFILIIILEGINQDKSWLQSTNFYNLKSFYEPIKNNANINIIAPYPMILSNGEMGTPPHYQLLGQIFYEKPIVSGLSPFTETSNNYNSLINNIEDKNTIDNLIKYNIDTIVLYKNFLPNHSTIFETLLGDERLKYLGNLKGLPDNSVYVSGNELSRDIDIFQIKDVIKNNLENIDKQNNETALSNGKIIDLVKLPTGARAVTLNLPGNSDLKFFQPYNKNWQLFLFKIDHNYSWYDNLSFLFKKAIFSNTHVCFNGYANSWSLDTNYIKNNYSSDYVKTNPDGSITIKIFIYLKREMYIFSGKIISGTTLLCCLGYLGYDFVKRRKRRKENNKKEIKQVE